jgi:hypothetical protein
VCDQSDVRFQTIADISGFWPQMVCPLMTQRSAVAISSYSHDDWSGPRHPEWPLPAAFGASAQGRLRCFGQARDVAVVCT